MSEPDRPQVPRTPYPPPYYGAYPGSYPPPPPQPYAGYTPPPPVPKNGLGIAALVIAIIGLFTVFGGLVLGIVAIILGFIGWSRAKRGEATNGGVAIAGIVLGFLGVIVSIVAIFFVVWFFTDIGGTDYLECMSRAGSNEQAMQQCAEVFRDRIENEFSVTMSPTP